ncbi:hypothetical protein [Leifsonia sp. NPDC077715]|uniref:hypothetical protein n=1 Tax=Leifsonia sp. NPDC077715 TaxID=3155539 RepID=UPI003421295F
MVRVETEAAPLALFLALAVLFTVLGVVLLVRPGRAAAFFADEDARRPFRPGDARALGAVFALGGGILAVVGIVRLVAVLGGG